MSDPAKSIHVEDVLSSIRRIVTDETASAVDASVSAPSAPERFILTPALRVPRELAVAPKAQMAAPLALGQYRREDVPKAPDRDDAQIIHGNSDPFLLQAEHMIAAGPAEACEGMADDETGAEPRSREPHAHDANTGTQETATADADRTARLEQLAQVDPDMLRSMVAEIVREELQGPLGERITRNVRKLVRREINRAMTAHEFD